VCCYVKFFFCVGGWLFIIFFERERSLVYIILLRLGSFLFFFVFVFAFYVVSLIQIPKSKILL